MNYKIEELYPALAKTTNEGLIDLYAKARELEAAFVGDDYSLSYIMANLAKLIVQRQMDGENEWV